MTGRARREVGMMQARVGGVIAAVLTPAGRDLAPDVDRLAAHCRWLFANGCDGINLLGTTGEAASFSVAQRIAIMRGLAERGLPLDATLVGTGAAALDDALALTREAMSLGFAGTLIIPPFYYKDLPEDGVFAFYEELIARAGSVRLYFYHFPKMSGVPFTPSLVARLRAAFGEQLLGLKDSSGNAAYAAQIHREPPGSTFFRVPRRRYWRAVARALPGASRPPPTSALPSAGAVWRGGDDAENAERQAQLTAIGRAIASFALIPALHALVADLHGDEEWRRPMPPIAPLGAQERRQLSERLSATVFGKAGVTP